MNRRGKPEKASHSAAHKTQPEASSAGSSSGSALALAAIPVPGAVPAPQPITNASQKDAPVATTGLGAHLSTGLVPRSAIASASGSPDQTSASALFNQKESGQEENAYFAAAAREREESEQGSAAVSAAANSSSSASTTFEDHAQGVVAVSAKIEMATAPHAVDATALQPISTGRSPVDLPATKTPAVLPGELSGASKGPPSGAEPMKGAAGTTAAQQAGQHRKTERAEDQSGATTAALQPAQAVAHGLVTGDDATYQTFQKEMTATKGAPAAQAPSAADLQQTFSALDSGGMSGTEIGHWTHAGKASAEAGFDDPTLGWIGVRAELGPSGVHASLLPGSADAVQSMHAHLPELNAYLAEHRMPVETLKVAAPANEWSGFGQGHQGGQQGGGDAQQNNAASGQKPADTSRAVSTTQDTTKPNLRGAAISPIYSVSRGSNSISVIA